MSSIGSEIRRICSPIIDFLNNRKVEWSFVEFTVGLFHPDDPDYRETNIDSVLETFGGYNSTATYRNNFDTLFEDLKVSISELKTVYKKTHSETEIKTRVKQLLNSKIYGIDDSNSFEFVQIDCGFYDEYYTSCDKARYIHFVNEISNCIELLQVLSLSEILVSPNPVITTKIKPRGYFVLPYNSRDLPDAAQSVFDILKDNKWINCTLRDFRLRFINKDQKIPSSQNDSKIIWLGEKSDLKYFIKSVIPRKKINPQPYQIAHQVFKLQSGYLVSKLNEGDQGEPTPKFKKSFENLVAKFSTLK